MTAAFVGGTPHSRRTGLAASHCCWPWGDKVPVSSSNPAHVPVMHPHVMFPCLWGSASRRTPAPCENQRPLTGRLGGGGSPATLTIAQVTTGSDHLPLPPTCQGLSVLASHLTGGWVAALPQPGLSGEAKENETQPVAERGDRGSTVCSDRACASLPKAKRTQRRMRGQSSCCLLPEIITLEKGRRQAAGGHGMTCCQGPAVGRTRLKTGTSAMPGSCARGGPRGHSPHESQGPDQAGHPGDTKCPIPSEGSPAPGMRLEFSAALDFAQEARGSQRSGDM